MLFLEFQKTNYLDKETDVMKRKDTRIFLFARALILLFPSMMVETKTKTARCIAFFWIGNLI